jgi:pimeloyl-ACP methyl ester carboxylesterase
MADRVVLVHGLWLNGASMAPLGWRLARAGFAVSRFGYWSVLRGLDANVDRLLAFCRRFKGDRLFLVGHSLGGVLILAALKKGLEAQRVVLMGSPYHGSLSARGLARVAVGKRMLGRTLTDWLACDKSPGWGDTEVGVLAGSREIGFGRFISPLPSPNDGVVSIEETRVPGAADSVVLPVFHTAMPFSPVSARAAATFLRKGRFQ